MTFRGRLGLEDSRISEIICFRADGSHTVECRGRPLGNSCNFYAYQPRRISFLHRLRHHSRYPLAMPDFSTPAEHAFEAQDLDTDPSQTLSTSTTALSLSSRYSIESTLSHILANDAYRVIALQFPDELLHESVLVYRMLMKGFKEDERRRRTDGVEVLERQCYVLGDSTYGSCCPDVLSSLHLFPSL
jgi:hypothetical protein